MRKSTSGFTIVELLIVVVVIAILAAVSTVAYSNIQNRARDSQRVNDIGEIVKSLNRYYVINSRYPSPTSLGGSWERSDSEPAANFMEYLANDGFPSGTPVDPINNSTYNYQYYRYSAGSHGCDAARGAFFVLGVRRFESSSGIHPQSPGFSCSGRDWQSEYAWVVGTFER